MSASPYCLECGSRLEAGSGYCGACGAQSSGPLETPRPVSDPLRSPPPLRTARRRGSRPRILIVLPIVTGLVGLAAGFGAAGLGGDEGDDLQKEREIVRLIDTASNGKEGALHRRLAALGAAPHTTGLAHTSCTKSKSRGPGDRDAFDCTLSSVSNPVEESIELKRVTVANDDSHYGIYWEEPTDPTR